MKKILMIFLLLSMILSSLPLFADLGDFKDDVEEAESKDTDTESEQDEDEESEEADEENGDCLLCEIFWEILKTIWIYNNTSTTYGSYPYADDGYINLAISNPDYDPYERNSEEYLTTGWRDQWFSLESQFFQLSNLGYGTWFTLKGHLFRFFGPYLESWIISDGTDNLIGLRLGGMFSLLQTDPFSISLYGQYQQWSGILARSGGIFGLEIRSYPAKPISFQIRAAIQYFGTFNLAEAEIQIGIHLDRFELFGGYRWWNLVTSSNEFINQYNGFFTGLRLHF